MDFAKVSQVWDCTKEEWNDWQWQLENSITSVQELKDKFSISDTEASKIKEAADMFPMSITPYYASLIDFDDELCPIKQQAVPNRFELKKSAYEMEDPLHEDEDSPVDGLTHRYPDRVLLLVTNECSMFCRHCTRKRKVGDQEQTVDLEQIEKGIEYIKKTPQVRDVLLSGGDPLLVDEDILKEIITKLYKIPHVEVVRVGSRLPVVLPQRIDDSLVKTFKEITDEFGPIWINTHFNHEKEITPEAKEALAKLANAGIPLGNQTVLLKDVNDCPEIIKDLMHKLVQNRVRPYYLYQCDLSRGIEHFRTPISKGIEIMEHLIGHTSGFAVPRFVVDAPGGGGKIPLTPNYLLSNSNRKTILRNFEGTITVYTEPKDQECNCPPECTICDNPLVDEEAEQSEIGLQQLFSEDNDTVSLQHSKRDYTNYDE
ncbi:lysine-2,3-aminomutase [Halobacteroides halobius DSM 5150]|uniref:L-lysine 2,3-aminomutase n=1 Tax=Halobacteroides halobius (strain ATCC 35273 / DSM 5150 / MD-1) TaxID=748449 RepID=L0K8F0_HALHC|nr:lysine 2,3-aminomutase [Halobacteroides halobius]AGB41567.1 lysine-2,3-aminomutase [Halobacteroides halobius DSM 5150]